MGALAQDVRFAWRTLSKSPAFTLTAIIILATGIGATTAIFSVVDTVILRPMPYPNAGELVHFDNGAHSFPSLRAWSEMSSFQTLSAVQDVQVDLTGEGAPERLPAVAVSEDFFEMLGVGPHLGRLLLPSDQPNEMSVVVLSHPTWVTRYGSDPGVIGETVRLNGQSVEIVGVLEEGFVPPERTTGNRVDFWLPLGDGGDRKDAHGFHTLGVIARLAPGVTRAAAQTEVDAQRDIVAQEVPDQYVNRDGSIDRTPLTELKEATVSDVSGTLWILLGAVTMLLLIACANVANLFLARGTARTREIALRGALGASRKRIAAQVLTESVLLATVGGLLGVAVAFGGVELIARFNPGGVPRMDDLSVDGRVLAFSLAVSVATGVLFGWLPGIQASRGDVNKALKDGAGSVTTSRAGRRLRSGLIVAEIALALVLLIGGGLLMRTFLAQVSVDPGFDTGQMIVLPLSTDAGYEDSDREQFARDLIGRIEEMPRVRAVSGGWAVPYAHTGGNRCCWRTTVVGDPVLQNENDPYLSIVHPVFDGYFEMLGAPIALGREFDRSDMNGDAQVAVVNRRTAEDLFGTESVIGRTLDLGDEPFTVVGVVEGVHHWGASEGVEPAVYVPFYGRGASFWELTLAIRADGDFDALAASLRDAVWSIDANLPIPEITTMEAMVSRSVATPRFLSGLLGAFAAVALVLACGGIYGSMLYTVGQRRQEMGIRLALGAERIDLITMVLRYGVALALVGIAIGCVAGLGVSRVMEELLWGVQPTDPVTFVSVSVILAGAAVLASFVPAWSAARTDPLDTLKAE